MRLTRKCAGCGQDIRKDEMIEYSSISGKTSKWFCRACYEEKIGREKFANRICQIFGLKSPGPVIWTQRKKLQEEFGYTDDIILDTLDYVYNVKKIKKLSETLYFVRPTIVNEMKQWKNNKELQAGGIAAATKQMVVHEYIISVNDKKKERKTTNLEDGLFDD